MGAIAPMGRSYTTNRMTNPKVIFAGTPDFAVASLKALVDSGVAPIAVLTQPDRPAGRGKRLSASPVKLLAEELGIPVLQPKTLRDASVVAELEALQPDLIVVAAYGLLLPQNVLDIPRAGCLNVHASLLPRWRGAAPIQAVILAGDEKTGVCLMSMEAGLDTGPVYGSDAITINDGETAGELHDRLAKLGGRVLAQHIKDIASGKLEAIAQDDNCATYAGKIETADAAIDWQHSARQIERQVRAFNPVPGAWFMHGDERIKCWRAKSIAGVNAPPGTVVTATKEGIVIACGDGALSIESLQRPGKRAVTAGEFANQIDLAGQRL
jgi:methionyl-tRNA formyltransferase